MGVYIKGMEMPTNCTHCSYRLFAGCNPYQDNGLSPNDHRHITCPLTEVPEPHGRLIDADEFVKQCKPRGIANTIWEESHQYKQIITAPTVIERSK